MHEAGGRVGDINGNPLDFSAGRTLSANGGGVIAASAKIFDAVISAVQTTLAQKSQ
ncbi:hypothetical protein J3B02_004728 [Coemansia erecta]|nr:hypothetical protein J3B02_004728 [Coemansia erecta]